MANEACQMSASEPSLEPNFVMVPPDAATASVERLRRQALRLLTESQEEDTSAGRRATAPDDAPGGPARAPAASMIAGVIAMPAAFLAVVFIAIALFGKPGEPQVAALPAVDRLAQPAAPRAASPVFASATTDARGAIALGEDARIASIALDGDRVALSIESPAGREILIYDYRERRQIGAARIETIGGDAVDTLGMLTGPPPVAVPSEPDPALAEAPRIKPRATP